jgi:protein SCO1
MKHTILILLCLLTVVAGGLSLFRQRDHPPQKTAALIGGSFTLIDQEGRTRTDQEFRGKLMLVFFGFTHCPDVCPMGLTQITRSLAALQYDAQQVSPVFITVDPERDTPEVIKAYLQHFHPAIAGLTGSKEQVQAVMEAYKVYAVKVEGTHHHQDSYPMSHSGYMYLMNRSGTYLTHLGHPVTSADIVRKIRAHL